MTGIFLEGAGWVLALLNLAGAGFLLGASAAMGRTRPGRWGVAEGLLGLLTLIWVGIGASAVCIRLATGSFEPGPELPMGPALAGTAIGGISAAAACLLRAGPRGLGLTRLAPQSLALGLLGLIPLLGLGSLWVWVAEQLVGPVEDQQLLQLLHGEAPVLAVGIAIYGVLVAPVVEEIVFRGLLLPPLTERLGAPVGIFLSALLFGALHLSDPVAVPPLIALGVWLAFLRHRSGALWPVILVHAVNNALAVGAALLA